jgi:hypothetical protein
VEQVGNAPVDGTDEDPVYQSQRVGLKSYCLPVPNGTRSVVLKFCELKHAEKGKRIFTVKIQGRPVLKDLDIFAEAGRGKALDKTIGGIVVTDGWLVIEFVPQVDEPCLAAVQDNVPYGMHRYNCGGTAFRDYLADPEPVPARGRYLPSHDFYRDWATQLFGKSVGEQAGALFARIDNNLPRPSNWVNGPGAVYPDGRPWDQILAEYGFIGELEALRPLVRGAGNLERFDYWLNSFRYMRATAWVDSVYARQNQALEAMRKLTDEAARKKHAREVVLPIRQEMINAVREVYTYLLPIVTNPSELGTIANWEQHSMPGLLDQPGEELAKVLGDLGPEPVAREDFAGSPRLIVPAVRTSVLRGETLRLKVIVEDRRPQTPVLHWRPMGTGEFRTVTATHRARAVYDVEFPAGEPAGGCEYYLEYASQQGPVRFPATAPQLNQTVVVEE